MLIEAECFLDDNTSSTNHKESHEILSAFNMFVEKSFIGESILTKIGSIKNPTFLAKRLYSF